MYIYIYIYIIVSLSLSLYLCISSGVETGSWSQCTRFFRLTSQRQ